MGLSRSDLQGRRRFTKGPCGRGSLVTRRNLPVSPGGQSKSAEYWTLMEQARTPLSLEVIHTHGSFVFLRFAFL